MAKIFPLAIFTLVLLGASLFGMRFKNNPPLSPTPPSNPFGKLLQKKKEIPEAAPNLVNLKRKTRELILRRRGTYGVFVKDFKSSSETGINEEEIFYAASLNKIPIMMALFEQVDKGKIKLEEKTTYLEEDFEGGDGSIKNDPFGTEYAVSDVVTRMIKESDNVAKNILLRRVGYKNIKALIEKVGAKNTYLPDNTTTPADTSLFLENIYKAKIVSRKSSKTMLDLMTETSTEDRLPYPLIGKGVKVAHKIGTWEPTGSYHDCGLVFGRNPYLLCILSRDTTYQEALKTIRAISQTVFETLHPL